MVDYILLKDQSTQPLSANVQRVVQTAELQMDPQSNCLKCLGLILDMVLLPQDKLLSLWFQSISALELQACWLFLQCWTSELKGPRIASVPWQLPTSTTWEATEVVWLNGNSCCICNLHPRSRKFAGRFTLLSASGF